MDDPLKDFEYGPVVGDFTRSYQKANAECLRLGFKYAAIQEGNKLFCNYEYPSYPRADPKDCEEKRCVDDPSKPCGGKWRNIIIKVLDPPLGLVDCKAKRGVVMLGPQLSSFSLSGPVKGWAMRAKSKHPQVLVSTNDVLSICENDELCKFYYDPDVTPILESGPTLTLTLP